MDLQTGYWLMEEKSKSVVVGVSDRPDWFGVGMVFHVSEILEPFSIIAIPVHEVIFVDFERNCENAEKWEEDFVMDML